MHVVIAPDSFDDNLTATQAAHAIADGWSTAAPHDLLSLVPLGDGGPGFIDVLATGGTGEIVAVTASDPLGRPVPAAILVTESDGLRTAYVEAAQAAGLHLLEASERNPARTSTYGVGELLRAARSSGARRIVVGLGGCGTNDAGAGMLAALGVGRVEQLGRGGLPLGDLDLGQLFDLPGVRSEWVGIDLVLATDDDTALFGLRGTSAVDAPSKGASPQLAQELESSLGHFSDLIERSLGPLSPDLLTGRARRRDKEPGAGAGGGLGYALIALGGSRASGVEVVMDAVGFAEVAAAADLIITGEGTFDWQSLTGSVVSGVAQAAVANATPAVVIAARTLVGRREAMTLGVSGTYALAATPAQEEAVFADPVGALRTRAARLAATWSPAR